MCSDKRIGATEKNQNVELKSNFIWRKDSKLKLMQRKLSYNDNDVNHKDTQSLMTLVGIKLIIPIEMTPSWLLLWLRIHNWLCRIRFLFSALYTKWKFSEKSYGKIQQINMRALNISHMKPMVIAECTSISVSWMSSRFLLRNSDVSVGMKYTQRQTHQSSLSSPFHNSLSQWMGYRREDRTGVFFGTAQPPRPKYKHIMEIYSNLFYFQGCPVRIPFLCGVYHKFQLKPEYDIYCEFISSSHRILRRSASDTPIR